MKCTRCHREIPDESGFCLFCGKRQTATTAPPQRRSRRRAKGSGSVYKISDGRSRPWAAMNGAGKLLGTKRQTATTAPPQRRSRRRAKGSGSVYKISDGRSRPWAAMNGAGKLLGTYASSSEAVEALDRFNADRVPLERKNYTLRDIYEQWSPNAFAKIGDKSRQSYEDAFAKAADLHSRRIRDLKTEDYQQVIDSLVQRGLSRSLCEKQRLLFSKLCQYAMKQDIIDKNYAQFLELPSKGEAKTRVLSDEEIGRIRGMLGDPKLGPTAEIALVLCYSGMRINELLQMERENVHLADRYMVGGEKTDAGRNRTIPIHREIIPIIEKWMDGNLLQMERENVHLADRYMVGGEKTDAGRNRTIPIHREIIPIIEKWMDGNTTSWLLHTSAGTAKDADNVRKAFRSLMKACEISGVTPHTCRHTAATKMVAAGVRPEIIKQILGHPQPDEGLRDQWGHPTHLPSYRCYKDGCRRSAAGNYQTNFGTFRFFHDREPVHPHPAGRSGQGN